MRWKKWLSAHLLVTLLALGLIAAGDDVEVFSSPNSVLSIYSYGAAARTPELHDWPNLRHKSTAPLTDVDATPVLSQSLPAPRPPARSTSFAPKSSALPMLADTSAGSSSGATPATQAAPPVVGTLPPSIVLGWDPSPDESVVGYVLYVGSASHRYTSKQTIGNLTSVRVVIDQPTLYFAVAAYTYDGLESVLSDEFAVTDSMATANTQQSASRATGNTGF
jgi:hypothetical protein